MKFLAIVSPPSIYHISSVENRKWSYIGGQTYYTVTKGIWTCGLRPHALRVITSCANELLLPIRSRFSSKKSDITYLKNITLFYGGLQKNDLKNL